LRRESIAKKKLLTEMNRRAAAEAERQKAVQESIALEEKLLEAEEGLEKANALLKKQRMLQRTTDARCAKALPDNFVLVGLEADKLLGDISRLEGTLKTKEAEHVQRQQQLESELAAVKASEAQLRASLETAEQQRYDSLDSWCRSSMATLTRRVCCVE